MKGILLTLVLFIIVSCASSAQGTKWQLQCEVKGVTFQLNRIDTLMHIGDSLHLGLSITNYSHESIHLPSGFTDQSELQVFFDTSCGILEANLGGYTGYEEIVPTLQALKPGDSLRAQLRISTNKVVTPSSRGDQGCRVFVAITGIFVEDPYPYLARIGDNKLQVTDSRFYSFPVQIHLGDLFVGFKNR